jgi:hypothetical protein
MNKIKSNQAQAKSTANDLSNSPSWLTENNICLILLLFIIGMVLIIRTKFSGIPFERDEGAYSYYGKLLLEGKIPYKDFYEQKFPGIFYFFGFIVYIFGSGVKELHTGFMYLNIATIILIYFAVKKLFNAQAAIISASTFAFVSLTPTISGFTIQSEHGVAFFSSVGIFMYAMASTTKKWFYYLAMGLAMGAAFMTKTTGLFMALWGGLILLIDFFFNKPFNYKHLFKSLGFYSLGGFSVIAILFLMMYVKGAFNDMLFWTIEIPTYYVNRMPLEEGLKYFGYTKDAIFQFNKFFWMHSLFAIILIFIKSIDWKTKLFTISLGTFSFMTIVPGYYFYGHYWLQLLPGLAILSGVTCYAIILFLKKQFNIQSSYVKYAYLGLFAIITYSHLNKFKNYYFKPNYEQILKSTYGNNPFPESMEIANFINQNSKETDQLAIIGSEPQIYIYTNKKSPTRHIFFSTIVADVPQHKQWQREYAADIEKANPKHIIFFNHQFSLLVQPNTDKYIFEWANAYISKNYHIVGIVDMIEGQRSNYLWREQLMNYKPVSQNVIYIYERNK